MLIILPPSVWPLRGNGRGLHNAVWRSSLDGFSNSHVPDGLHEVLCM
jgi:hypothetical protein